MDNNATASAAAWPCVIRTPFRNCDPKVRGYRNPADSLKQKLQWKTGWEFQEMMLKFLVIVLVILICPKRTVLRQCILSYSIAIIKFKWAV
ncbi:hypothetical protein T11_9012 [Trichinella zimbabwensis]|uniref:Uncharacterized protein n=1 Tax=Trichinella zimbabwensis TaxID=268475 RepID=A0A0V1GXL4_9BILA|nr:hypothetical protein T11_9012 [Trichinella zimbabwensis]